jgi:hypothetical protein
MLLASCGGGDSSGRTRNVALCYADQAEKDAAVQAAQDAFDAAMGGGTPGDPLSDTTVPATEDSVVETEDSVVDEAPSDTVLMESSPADGGGYRRPAVRAASSGDTSVPADEESALTPEQQQAQIDLEAAEAQSLCEGDGAISAEKTCDITLTREIEWSGASNCEEVVVEIVNTMATAAVGWQANVGSQVVASGTWDSDSEQTKVVTFTYTPEAAQDAASEESTTVTCTGTISGTAEDAAMSDDCPDGFVYSSLSADGMIWVLNKDGNEMGADGAVLASGPLDISGLTPETPVTFKISYDIASQDVSSETTDGEDSPCSMTLTSTGVSWRCSDGSLFNVAIEDMSNRGVYPLVECASEGSLTVADGQQFFFNFYLVNGEQTFLDGYNTDWPQNEPIGFTVPEDTAGVCTQSAEDEKLSGVLSVPGVYGFTADETVRTDLHFATEGECSSENDFAINWYEYNSEIGRYEYSSTSYAETMIEETTLCGYADDSYYGGDWIAEFVGDTEVAALTNVVFSEVDPALIGDSVLPELADMPNSYTFDRAIAQYDFVLTEETRVSITVNSNQSCDVSETDLQENGFTDPEIDLYEGNAPWSESNDNEIADDDNGFHSADNCSAAFFDGILPAGNYFIWAENDDYSDGDTGTITVNSSIELTAYEVNLGEIELTTKSVTVPDAMKFQVPAGGAQLVATLDSLDPSCDVQDPAIAVIDLSSGVTMASDDDDGEDLLGMNGCSSFINVNLDEGEYLMVFSTFEVMFDEYLWDEDGSGFGSTFELKYGFSTESGSGVQIVVEESNDPIPPVQVPPTADLPIEQLKSESNSTLAVAEGVSTMVCSSTCVEDLFALEGVTGDVLTVSVGSESILVKRGASKVRVPVSAGAKELVVTQKTASGATEVVSSTKVITAPANLGATSTSTSSESGSNMLLLIVLGLGVLVIAGAGTTLVRRRKAN